MTESISPRSLEGPEPKYQPSMLSLPSAASTVLPAEDPATPLGLGRAKQRGTRRRLWFFTALAVASGVAVTLGIPSQATVSAHVHSGSPGFKRSTSGANLRWNRAALTIYIDDSLARIGPDATGAVASAFGSWVESDRRLPDLTFDTGDTSAIPKQDAKSTVSYGRINLAGHERDLALTVTYANDKSGEIIEADIVLNSLYPLSVLGEQGQGALAAQAKTGDASNRAAAQKPKGTADCGDRYDVQNVATHEAGHFFGLGEDPVERNAAMFQTIDECEVQKRVLAASDVGAIATLYAGSEDPEEAAAGPRACSFGRGNAGSGAAWASALLMSLGLARRRRSR